jgi:hypothetical protein
VTEARGSQTPDGGRDSAVQAYSEIFALEIDSWCFGLSRYGGELTAALVHRVVEELAPVFRSAIDHCFVFDLLGTAKKINQAASNAVDQIEITLNILSQLPCPYALDEERQFVYAQIIDQAEKEYSGVLECFEKRWQKERDRTSEI